MATTPTFLGPDGVQRTQYIFTTDQSTRFFTGQMDADTVDMRVSIRGGAESADPDLITFEGTSFTIPNPSAFPEGMSLLAGSNLITVRSVLSNGETTPYGTIQANLALDRDTRSLVPPPTGVFLEQKDQTVAVSLIGGEGEDIVGYNFYAATSPGGGLGGYKRVNIGVVTAYDEDEEVTAIGSLTADSVVDTNDDGSPVTDPLYFRITGAQTDEDAVVISTDFDEQIEVPETAGRLRTVAYTAVVTTLRRYSFTHDRGGSANSTYPTIPNSEFTAVPSEDPLYYTATAIYLIDGVEYESSMSQEVAGRPLMVTTSVADLPTVSRQQIIRDSTLAIFRSRPDVDVKPGSYLRDTFLDPFATESERLRFIINFLQAAQSFTTLLAIDDPTGSGTSVSVAQSPYKIALKQAFFLQDNQSAQNLIDNAFDHLASRRGVTRLLGQRAKGEVTFYVTVRPANTRYMALGTIVSGGAIRCRTISGARITSSGAGSIFNPGTGRWAATAYVEAESIGSAGNLAGSQITTIVDGPRGVKVTNANGLFGGTDAESNYALAVRADGVLSSVDTGTYRGYVQTAAKTAGVEQVNVVDGGHALMMRDMDLTTGQHWGGKVDVWVRGSNLATVTDTFAFSFQTVVDGRFLPVGDIQNLRFRVVNTAVTADNPIIEMMENADWDYEFRAINASDGSTTVLDLTDAIIIAPDGLQLSTDYNDPNVLHLKDIFEGTYRYRTSVLYEFTRQPVTEILSFYRVDSNGVQQIVSDSAYKLFHPSGPLELGTSTEAGNYLQVIQPIDGTAPVNLPSGDAIVVTGESHTLLDSAEYLNNLGVNKRTVHIWNVERTVEYRGPYHPGTAQRDFSFVDELGQRPVAFTMISAGALSAGMSVVVDYEHDENYVVKYKTDSLVGVVQTAIDEKRHSTADVLAKSAFSVGVDIQATVVLQLNQTASVVDGAIRTALGRLFGRLGLGLPIRQGDVIKTIESTSGVSYVVVPLVEMDRQDGSVVIQETVITTESTDSVEITDWSTDNVKVYLLTNPLLYGTINGGGDFNDFRGVRLDDLPLTLNRGVPAVSGSPLKGVSMSACIIGDGGAAISGYTGLTARRVLVALPTGTTPASGEFKVTYIVDKTDVTTPETKNIEPGPLGYLELGDLEFTYDEDDDFTSQVTRER
jgi:hypothetical protein